LFSRNHISLNY